MSYMRSPLNSKALANGSTPKVSLIMAAYNAEATIERAVKSVMLQTYPHWELIIIDDGSTDATPSIADNLAGNMPGKIHVVHQPNAGVSAVRRLGLNMAGGDYIIHIDSDDYAEPRMLELMIGKALDSGADMVISDYFRHTLRGECIPCSQSLEGVDNNSIIDMLVAGYGQKRMILGVLWNKLISRELYQRAAIDFSEQLTFGEDLLAVIKMLQAGAKTAFVPVPLYHYIVMPGSLVNSGGAQAYQRRLEWLHACEKIIGRGHESALDLIRYHLKFYAFDVNPLPAREFYHFSSTPWHYLPTITYRRRLLPAMVLATLRLYPLAHLWARVFGSKKR